ncbi:DUF6712 family protein [Siphonobacter curvatus]|uniref:Uncharacterized protein n=1 Tax=Siphonobacter curvatus TaxID=2094562 RepID=A0A2S7IN49_9BACT|nr:DUF6712 family protein [Siphonobacter curvatus]PQA59154.1 hypothetical protein C5O19_05725 [Siphonobacter curvatus]
MLLSDSVIKARLGAVQTKLGWETMKPYAESAERKFKGVVGLAVCRYLETITTQSDAYELRALAESALTWSAYVLALPHLKVRVGDLGLMKTSPPNTVAITKWEYIDTLEAAEKQADENLEDFFELLDALKPAAWTESTAYAQRRKHFIRSYDELAAYVSLGGGRNGRFFSMLVPYIARAEELYIRPLITPSDFAALLLKWQNPDTVWDPQEEQALEAIKKVVAPMAYYEAFPFLPLQVDQASFSSPRTKDGIFDERDPERGDLDTLRRQFFQDGQLYTAQLKTILDTVASPNLFPGYYQAHVKEIPDTEPSDYTHTSHVIL